MAAGRLHYGDGMVNKTSLQALYESDRNYLKHNNT